jgi:adenosylcobinamide kinase/adenosylcobinamide-phosphate guanylyltransferase
MQAAPSSPGSPRLVLVGGGVRCGKSAFALTRARQLGEHRLFIATAQAFDAEMTQRIADHQLERGALFETLEEPLALAETLRAHASRVDVIVIDCLTLWLSNLLLQDERGLEIEARVEELAQVLQTRTCHVIVVTNEVGMGLVPDYPLGRRFRDCAGRAHQRLARESDEIYLGALGCLLRLRPAPMTLVPELENQHVDRR